MNKIDFKDLPDTTTPINAENLNQIQTNVENGIKGKYIWAYATGTQTIANNTETTVALNNTLAKTDDFTLSNNEIICNKSGVIATFCGVALSSGHTDQANIIDKVRVNGVEKNRLFFRPNGTTAQTTPQIVSLFSVNAGDKLTLIHINYSNSSSVINANAYYSSHIIAFYL